MCGFNVRYQRDVHVHYVWRSHFEDELPDRFEKWETFNVPGGAADLRDYDIVLALVRKFTDTIFDHVGDVRNHLHSFAEIVTATFL